MVGDLSAVRGERLRGVANVLVDGAPPRLGALSYRVPDSIEVRVGDAVHVPFGKREAYGLALGPGDVEKATRTLLASFGPRTHPADLAVAADMARHHFVDLAQLAVRLAPRSGKGADPHDAGPAALIDPDRAPIPVRKVDRLRRYLLRAPLVDPYRLAAESAMVMLDYYRDTHGEDGQVLVLCPTSAMVAAVLDQFSSGAARVDAAKATAGGWRGFVEGTVPVAVGTRAAAWFAPRRFAGIVVVEEHHPGHVEAQQPHTHTRDVALARTTQRDIPYACTGLCPSGAALAGGLKIAPAGTAGDWPAVTLVDRSTRDPGQRAFPTEVKLAVARAQRAGHKTTFIAERKTARRQCSNCRAPRPCAVCEAAVCAHPPAEAHPGTCGRCGGSDTKLVGWDAERIVAAFDRKVRAAPWSNLAKVSDAQLVVVFDADRPLHTASLEPESHAAQLLLSAAAQVNPGGTLMLVTSDPSDPVLAAITAGDQMALARMVWANAKQLRLPPFGRLIHVRAAREKAPATGSWPGQVAGPRKVADGEWEFLVRCADGDLPAAFQAVSRLRRSAKVRVTVS